MQARATLTAAAQLTGGVILVWMISNEFLRDLQAQEKLPTATIRYALEGGIATVDATGPDRDDADYRFALRAFSKLVDPVVLKIPDTYDGVIVICIMDEGLKKKGINANVEKLVIYPKRNHRRFESVIVYNLRMFPSLRLLQTETC